MGLTCAQCGYDNDPTRVYCHRCGTRLERGAQPAPSGFVHPADLAAQKKTRRGPAFGGIFGALLKLLVLGGLAAALVLSFLPPRDLPPPVAPDEGLADRLGSLVADSLVASGARSFAVGAADLNAWLTTSVQLRQAEGFAALKPVRVYAVPGDGVLRLGLQASTPVGLDLYFEGDYAPVKDGHLYRLEPRRFSVGRLPLPSVAGWLAARQLDGLSAALAPMLAALSRASYIGVTHESVMLRWSGGTP